MDVLSLERTHTEYSAHMIASNISATHDSVYIFNVASLA